MGWPFTDDEKASLYDYATIRVCNAPDVPSSGLDIEEVEFFHDSDEDEEGAATNDK